MRRSVTSGCHQKLSPSEPEATDPSYVGSRPPRQTDLERRVVRDRREPHSIPGVLWWIVAAFLAVQVYVIWFIANGPFVDEGLYTVAGMGFLGGRGLSGGSFT